MSNLFDTNQDDQVQIDPNKEYFPELVGEGKKFKDPEALAKKALYADAHIARIEKENAMKDAEIAKIRAEYNAAASLRELMNELTSKQKQDLENHEQPPVNNEVQSPAIKPEDVAKIVAEQLKASEQERVQQQNFNDVQVKLKERFGDNYANILKEQTQNLGLTTEMVNQLARTAPKAFFKTMGLDEKKEDLFQAPPKSTAFAPTGGNKRTWAWYENLRKSDPKTYNKPETQMQMMNDRRELGESFKDGDWYSTGFRSHL